MQNKRTVTTYCNVCEHSCGMQVTVQGNEILEIKGHPEHPNSKGFLCPKGFAAKDIYLANDRLKNPLKKEGETWKEISWDEAMDLCAEKLKHIREDYGPEGLFAYHGQSYLKSKLAYFLMNRFFNLYGAINLSSAGSECFISSMLAHFATCGNLPFPDYDNSSCILLWGTNPCASGGVGKSCTQMTRLLKEKKKSGAKLIVVDPRMTAAGRLADVFIQPRPGTDGALALGFIRAVLDEHLEDCDYIEKHTSGFDRLQEMIREYPLDKIEQITGVAQEEIKQAASLFACSKPACIKVGSGLEHHTNGVQTIRATDVLLAITGNIDVPGGNTFFSHTPFSAPEVNLVPMDKALGAKEHPMYVSMVNQAHAVAALGHILNDSLYPVRGMVVAGGAPLTVLANFSRVRQVMEKMEFIVVIDQFMTATAKQAHLVLPAAMFLERDEITTNSLNLQNMVFEPVGPWPDWKIWWELARRMGYDEHFPWDNTDEVMQHLLETTDFTLKQVRNTPGGIAVPAEIGKALSDGFYTYSGKIEIYSTSLESNGYDPLPLFCEPAESPFSTPDTAKDFPLILITGGRYPVFAHSQHRNIESLKKQFPEPLMEINPVTARAYGIDNGDAVKVESKRGSLRIRASFAEGILQGVVHLPHGWDDANCNILTDDEARDPVSGFPGLKSSLCRIKKA